MEENSNLQEQEVDIITYASDFLNRQLYKIIKYPIKILKFGKYVVNISLGSLIYIAIFIFTTWGALAVSFESKTNALSTNNPIASPNTNTVTPLTPQDINNLKTKISQLENEIKQMKSTGQSGEITQIESDLQEIKLAISGDPNKVLSVQRMDFEISNLTARVDSLDSLVKWVFGITLTLAFAILGVILPVSLKSFSSSKSNSKE